MRATLGARARLSHPAAGWPPAGRVAAGTTLLLGAGVPLVSHVLQPTLPDAADAIAWAAAEPVTADLTKSLDVLAVPFLVGTALVYVLLSWRRAPRLAWIGGTLLGLGLVGLAAVEGFEVLAVGLADDPRVDPSALALALDQTDTTAALVMLVLLVVGALAGTVVLAVALWRSGALPPLVSALVPVPLLIDVVVTEGLAVGPHWLSHAVATGVAAAVAWLVISSDTGPRGHRPR